MGTDDSDREANRKIKRRLSPTVTAISIFVELRALKMESAFSKPLTNSSISPFLFRLHRHFYSAPQSQSHSQILTRRLRCVSNTRNGASHFQNGPKNAFGSVPLKALRTLGAVLPLVRCRLQCVSSSASSFSTGGGLGGGGGGGDGGGSDGGEGASGEDPAEEAAAVAGDVIILDVGGMSCGGCAASVKRILESQPQVSSASVNLTTETAVVWPASDAKSVPNWQKQLGEALAKHLTSCGFKSNLRGERATEGDILE